MAPGRLPAVAVAALYVHVPFCFHKCHYCDFYSITRQSPERMERFVDLILAEAQMWGTEKRGPTMKPATLFFGGGTPSLLPPDQMERLIRGLKERFDFSQVSEWTVEVNPATANLDYCRMLRELGVDRLSFGAQSFRPDELQTLERHHDPQDVARSVDIAHSAGFKRFNLDLIYAIPKQDLQSWVGSLEAAYGLNPPHISCYNLTYESNTPIAVKRRLGQLVPVSEELEIEMLRFTRHYLSQRGMEPYEISNYALPGEECRHNLNYWLGGNYIGLGPSAASHVEGHRWRNRPHLGEWEAAIGSKTLPAIDVEFLGPDQRVGELAMLMLRLSGGINFADFAARTGYDARGHFADQIARFTSHGLLHADQNAVCLTEKGLPVADALAAEFLART
ncbi:MAG TPA: radical SAM family heme chaperone HemW [Humisphaera sp.]|jgi:oxygen-independent coproporphyrinogen-3 oxidase|nr:radical SAM family heme chaperone HemW [Humisphaera sp.]